MIPLPPAEFTQLTPEEIAAIEQELRKEDRSRMGGVIFSEERFWGKVSRKDGGCWLWKGAVDRSGYGRVCVTENGRKRELPASRVAYALVNGEIPEGKMVCHTCDNPPCCNPEHLWVGSNQDNQWDASFKRRCRGQDATHCANGHEYNEANTYWRADRPAGRSCRACNLNARRRYISKRTA